VDAIILCSGFGTRLGQIGSVTPKPLLLVKHKPIIEYVIDDIEKMPEVKRVIITSNMKFEKSYQEFVKRKRKAGFGKELVLVVEPVKTNEERLGSIGSTLNAIKKAKVKDDLLLVFGDNFFNFDMRTILNEFISQRTPAIVAYDVKLPEDAKRFGVISVKNGFIDSFEEKPEKPKSTLISTGIYFYPKETLEKMTEYIRAGGPTDPAGKFISWLVDHEKVRAIIPSKGEWVDIGNLEGHMRARFIAK
jgi:glucose-1-phosphate thymidylyltransferase